MFTLLLGYDGLILLIDIICAVCIYHVIFFIFRKEKPGKNDGADGSVNEKADPEIAIQRRRRVLIGVIIVDIMLLTACLFFMCYMPKRTFRELEKNLKIAYEEGIDKVPESAISDIEKNRNTSIFLSKDELSELNWGIRNLDAAIVKWRNIKLAMDKADRYYVDSTDTYFVELASYNRIKEMDAYYKPVNIFGDIYIIRNDANYLDSKPTDFPVYLEYVGCMVTLGQFTGLEKYSKIVSYTEYRKQMMERYGVDAYKRYRQAMDELEEINATQKTAEDMTDESEYPQGVTVDSNEAEASVPVYDAPLAVTADGQQISSAVNGPWTGPAD